MRDTVSDCDAAAAAMFSAEKEEGGAVQTALQLLPGSELTRSSSSLQRQLHSHDVGVTLINRTSAISLELTRFIYPEMLFGSIFFLNAHASISRKQTIWNPSIKIL